MTVTVWPQLAAKYYLCMLHNNVTPSGTRLLVEALVTTARVCYCFQPLGRNPLLNHFPPAGKISISGPVTRLGWLRNYPPLVRQSDGWRNPWLSWPGSNALKTECKLHNPAVCCDLWHCRAIGTWGWGRWQPRLPAGQAARISEEAWSFCTGSLTASHFGSVGDLSEIMRVAILTCSFNYKFPTVWIKYWRFITRFCL